MVSALSAPVASGADGAQAATATYYVDAANGNDSNEGTSPDTAWSTIGRANALDLGPGDRLLFRGGQTFVGNLRIGADDAGAAEDPVEIGSYGAARARFDAGQGTGVEIYNAGGVEVSGLTIAGAGYANGNRGSGVQFYTDLGDATKLGHVRVENVEVSGFGRSGVEVGAWPSDGSKSGFRGVRITGVEAHGNGDAGIQAYGHFSSSASGWAHEDVHIADCLAYDNKGIPGKGTNSGSGIVLGDVDGATIERSVAHHNGENNDHPGGGPVGIWAWDSNRVTVQHNESYANRTGTLDGGGFDLDGGVTNSVMQYNYSHENAGAGYLLAQFAGARPFGNNVVRYNISENDARRGAYGAVHFWNGNGANGLKETLVHNNTVYVSPHTGASPKAVRFDNATSDISLYNNVLVTTGGVPLIDVASGQSNLIFEGNDYWASGGAFKIRFGGATYASLGSWRQATGQEEDGTVDTGFSVDPELGNPGGGGTMGDAARLSDLAAYKLGVGSPMIDTALGTPTLQGLDSSPADFFGTNPPEGAGYDIGAHEAKREGIPPEIVKPRPAPGTSIRDRTPAVGATVRDRETGLIKNDIVLYVDGERMSFSYDPGTDRLSRVAKRLPFGRHTVEVEATDGAGNTTTKAWSFRVAKRG